MEPLTIAYLTGGALFALLALGIPVGVAMGLVGVGGMLLALGPNFAFGQLQTLPFAVVNDYSLAVLPMFVLMGVLAEASGVTTEVFRVAELWLRRLRGGLYQAVIVGSAIFAAISGSTAVNAVVFTRIAFPEMIKFGYSRSLSLGAIAGAGSFAAMIPPSITMVIYAVMTEQSVGQLLIAGVIPGLITAAVYLIGVRIVVGFKPDLAPQIDEVASLGVRVRALGRIWPIPVLLALVLGGIYTGLFPPSAAGAVGAFGTLLYALVRMGGVRGWLVPALQDAAFISCILFIVLIGGLLLSRMLVVVGVIDDIVLGVTSIADTPLKFMILASLVYLVLGCFLGHDLDDGGDLALLLPCRGRAGHRSDLVRHRPGQADRDLGGYAAGGAEPLRGDGRGARTGDLRRHLQGCPALHSLRSGGPRPPRPGSRLGNLAAAADDRQLTEAIHG